MDITDIIKNLKKPTEFKEHIFNELYERVLNELAGKRVKRVRNMQKKIVRKARNASEKTLLTGKGKAQRELAGRKAGRTSRASGIHKRSTTKLKTARSIKKRKSFGLK